MYSFDKRTQTGNAMVLLYECNFFLLRPLFPKIWILLQSTLKVLIPCLNCWQWYECFCWIGYHLSLSHCKAAYKVEKILEHFLSKLEITGCGCLSMDKKFMKILIPNEISWFQINQYIRSMAPVAWQYFPVQLKHRFVLYAKWVANQTH